MLAAKTQTDGTEVNINVIHRFAIQYNELFKSLNEGAGLVNIAGAQNIAFQEIL